MGIKDFLFGRKCPDCGVPMVEYHASGEFFEELRAGASRAAKIFFARFTGMNEDKMLAKEKSTHLRCPECGRIEKR